MNELIDSGDLLSNRINQQTFHPSHNHKRNSRKTGTSSNIKESKPF